ncbi:hypothetical protein JYQ62_13950 [Nostoc sp. UHCC 0702]|nr:hypothetical protein JYQ62_13950 [Nostoc sp. UHCC 0702]
MYGVVQEIYDYGFFMVVTDVKFIHTNSTDVITVIAQGTPRNITDD